VEAVAGLNKRDSGVHIEHARVARVRLGNTEYTKYDLPGAKNSCDALAKDTVCTLLPPSQKSRL
jgi:hypothetical protein